MNQSPMARTIITEGEDAALSMLATLFATRSPNSDPSSDLRGFRASDLEVVYGHGCILSAASPVLGSMIKTAAQKDKQEKKKTNSVIEILDVDSATLTEVFRFIYTGKVEDLQGNQISLLTASEKFHLNTLRLLCARSIRQSLPPEQAHNHLTRIALNQLPDLCLLMVFDHFSLNDLFLLTSVCTRWRGLLKSACCRRREVTLFVGHGARRLLLAEHRSVLEIPDVDDEDDNKNLVNLVRMSSNKSSTYTDIHLFFYHQVPDRLSTYFRNVTRLRLTIGTVTQQVLVSLGTLVCDRTSTTNQLTSLWLNMTLLRTVTVTDLASLFTQISSSSSLTELTLICRRFAALGLLGEELHSLQELLQPPVIGSLRSLTYHCSHPFDIPTFKQSVHSGMPHLTSLAIYSPFLERNHHEALRQMRDDAVSDNTREPYSELLSPPNALPSRIFTNLGLAVTHNQPELRYLLDIGRQFEQMPQRFTELRSLAVSTKEHKDLHTVMHTLSCGSLRTCLERLHLAIYGTTNIFNHDHDQFQLPRFSPYETPRSSSSDHFARLSVLELRFVSSAGGGGGGGSSKVNTSLEHWMPSCKGLDILSPRLRVLKLWFEGWVRCPVSAGQTCPSNTGVRRGYGIGGCWRITRDHLACIRPKMDELWNSSGNRNGNKNNPIDFANYFSYSDSPIKYTPPKPLLTELTSLMVRFADSRHFEHWPELVRKNDNDNDNQNNKKTV